MRAERLFDALEFDAAAAAFQDALREPGTRQERLRTYQGLALSEAFMGQTRRAQARFEDLLSLDPDATVSSTLGPKIRKPFDAARKKRKDKAPAQLQVARRPDGKVEAMMDWPPSLVTKVVVFVRQPGESQFKETEGPVSGPVLAPAPAVRAVEAYAEARDAAHGVLFEKGSAAAPLRFDATEEPPPAVVAAQPPKRMGPPAEERERPATDIPVEVRSRPKWPFVVGGVGVAVAAGVVAGIVLSKPPELKLPSADRTERLP
ncbi:hypothetical protein [Hyalangium minutum]|uniref:hypothetical protein n=1 Tax=Hyalangium minutum TaxID=394096 RepID=UPI0012F82822|nr:hypothetical protein [Hyalangium minutum]